MLMKVPMPCPEISGGSEDFEPDWGARMKRYFGEAIRDHIVFNPWLSQTVFKRTLADGKSRRRKEDLAEAGLKIRELLRQHKVDLIVLHSFGGADAAEIINEARAAGIPVALQLHYANERYLHFSIRKQVLQADAASGVSDVRLPRYLRGNFTNLLTGLDTDFFQRKNCLPVQKPFSGPSVFLPARIVATKGHDDLVTALVMLRDRGLKVNAIFAGRADDPQYEARLKQRIASLGLAAQCHFTKLLGQEELRNWYGACDVMAFPTYHHEGLPRVLLEAQALKVPVVAYDSGGTRAGFLDGQTGYLIKPGDLKSFVEAVYKLLSNPVHHAQIAEAGRKFVEDRFSLPALAKRHEDFCLKILSGRRARCGDKLNGKP